MLCVDFGSGYAPKAGFKTCDVTGFPWLDYIFDPIEYKIECKVGSIHVLNCRNVLHHVPDLERLFAEFAVKMASGGTLVITEPRREHYKVNVILDVLWYRFVIPRYEVWISQHYRDYISAAKAHFNIVSCEVVEEKEIVTFVKP